ncbi:MAG TPA: hypothetical protein VMH91_04130 [Candidatus Paceibacterota bacterium]|nr:hypothetical protein [Candidatus Paceibacterota bacterium]
MDQFIANWHAALAALSVLITLAAVFPYALMALRGKARPDFVTWFLWSLTSGIGALAQYAAGASWSLAVVVANAVATALITLLSLRFGIKKYSTLDTLCMMLAIAAILSWALTDDPLVALVLVIAADFLAAVPTIGKSYARPASENALTFFALALAAALGIAANTSFDFGNVAYPAYFVGLYVAIGLLVTRRRQR